MWSEQVSEVKFAVHYKGNEISNVSSYVFTSHLHTYTFTLHQHIASHYINDWINKIFFTFQILLKCAALGYTLLFVNYGSLLFLTREILAKCRPFTRTFTRLLQQLCIKSTQGYVKPDSLPTQLKSRTHKNITIGRNTLRKTHSLCLKTGAQNGKPVTVSNSWMCNLKH